MMNIDLLLALIAFATVSSATPGPNNLMLLTSGTNFGFRRTLPHGLGISIGFTIMVILVGTGLMQIFDQVPYSYLALKISSVTYLLYLAWKIATAAPAGHGSAETIGKPFTFLQAALFQWVNPKAWAMALTAISAYTPQPTTLANILLVGVVFGLINLPVISMWIALGTQIRRLLKKPFALKIFNWTMAILLVSSLYPILFSIKI